MTKASILRVAPVEFVGLARWLTASSLLVILSYLLLSGRLSVMLAAMFVVALLVGWTTNRVTSLLLMISYLFLLGDIRRAVAYMGASAQPDPLLLVGPLFTIAIALPLLIFSDVGGVVTKAMLGLLAVMTMEIFNPLQGGTAVGLGGAMFYIVPVLWFWIGRQFGSPALIEAVLYRVVFPLGIAAAVIGLLQTFVGFTAYQQAWIDSVSREYSSLHLGGSIRAFGFSTSAAEYGVLLMIANAGIVAASVSGRRLWVLAVPLLLIAIILASGRTILVRVVIASAIVWALRNRRTAGWTGIVRSFAYGVAGLLLVGFVATQLLESAGRKYGVSAARDAIVHQASGLANPLDSRGSTAALHLEMVMSAIADGVSVPLGHGLGSTTLASAKFGGASLKQSSEVDFGDSFIGLGVVGGMLYLAIVALATRAAFSYFAHAPTPVGLPVLAVLLATVGSWLIGGQYAVSCLMLFLVGAVAYVEERSDMPSARAW